MSKYQKLLLFCALLIASAGCSKRDVEKNSEQFAHALTHEERTCLDKDGDGFSNKMCGGNDCDDSNPNVNPNA